MPAMRGLGVLCLCSTVSSEHSWEAMPGAYFCTDPEEIEKEEQATAGKAVTKEDVLTSAGKELLSKVSLFSMPKLQFSAKIPPSVYFM